MNTRHAVFFVFGVFAFAAHAGKTVIIGDSLSDDGGFGSGLAKELSSSGTACSFAASNSRFESWADGDFSCCRVGSHSRIYQAGAKVGGSEQASPPSKWSLSKLLDPESGLCGNNREEHVDTLVVQLGTNPSRDYASNIKKILDKACAAEVKNVRFVLPPNQLNDRMVRTDKKYAVAIDSYARSGCAGMKTSYFPSAVKSPIKAQDFRRDGTHFWDTPSERAWLEAVKNWARGGYAATPVGDDSTIAPENSGRTRVRHAQ